MSDDNAIGEELVSRAKRWDEEAWVEIVGNLERRLFSYFLSRAKTYEDAEDLTQDVFEKLAGNIHRFKWIGSPFESWVFQIASNTLTSYFRKVPNRIPPQPLENKHERTAEENLIAELEIGEYSSYFGDMTENYQLIIALHAFFGLAFKQIAMLLDIDYTNSKVQAYKARRKLRDRVRGRVPVRHGNGRLCTFELVRTLRDAYIELPVGLSVPFTDALLLKSRFELEERGYSVSEVEKAISRLPQGFIQQLSNMIYH